MDYLSNLDSDVAPIYQRMGPVELSAATVPRLRDAGAAAPVAAGRPAVVHEDFVVPVGGSGDLQLTVRIHRPAEGTERARPCLFWLHGGGFVSGSFKGNEDIIDDIVESTGCVVASPDYRLAPENGYPAALDDCIAALDWFLSGASGDNIDPARLTVYGISAGGCLAAALCLWWADHGKPPIGHQVLVYPMLDDRFDIYPSSAIHTLRWNRKDLEYAWKAYLGPARAHPEGMAAYASPGRATSLGHLPPTFIAVGALDVLRDEGIHFALRTLEAGVMTELHVYPGAPHGFDRSAPDAAVSKRFRSDLENYISRAFAKAARDRTD